MSTGPLPDFERPPVNEVVLSVQFEPLSELHAAHLGLLWGGFRQRFPSVQHQPALPSTKPENVRTVPPPVELSVELGASFFSPRLFFISEDQTELIQVQSDRFIANWRRVRDEDEYPRYEHVRGYFDEAFAFFRDFVAQQGLGEIRPIQYEVIYLNQLFAGEGFERLGQLSHVFSFWSDEDAARVLGEPETASIAIQHLIPFGGEPQGRLYVDVRPSVRQPDLRQLLAMNLTARVLAGTNDTVDTLGGIDTGHEHIVRAFAALTTPAMHELWGRRDA